GGRDPDRAVGGAERGDLEALEVVIVGDGGEVLRECGVPLVEVGGPADQVGHGGVVRPHVRRFGDVQDDRRRDLGDLVVVHRQPAVVHADDEVGVGGDQLLDVDALPGADGGHAGKRLVDFGLQ